MVDLSGIRCPLFVPANRPDRFVKAAQSGADAVILDLEDAVAREEKDEARALLRTDFTKKPVIVRINATGTSWHEDDLAAVGDLPDIAAIMLPKAEDISAIKTVSATLNDTISIFPLIETAIGLTQARAIAALPTVERLVFGSIDFCADMGCEHQRDVLTPARFELVLASRLAGIAAPIDGVTANFNSDTQTHDDAVHALAVGMTGKLCIHPRQIPEVQRAFMPPDAEIEWAKRVAASGNGAVSIDGAMIDEPVRLRARSILARVGLGRSG
ncbi:CoA ester lyase [Notoacmeibacter sp. MSK16QG-6]|uniref:HpcH/HpaI aldolase/citrate lyase family protein n=1 Tax=Notoacmeibacter sp. MSK16QG-6 TaxID=2957982 RepID=UPI00209E821F|nr:CoA ester lyase [Notoacmeibacter sp. MSK16QG-6]MCP1198298.1 CoA ester lyase [Notoacmeibacter sp. MSK16QG-6]